MTVRRRFIIAFIAAVLLVSAVPALAQVRRIQGKVVDGEGQPVAGAAIEATIVSLADADFAVRKQRSDVARADERDRRLHRHRASRGRICRDRDEGRGRQRPNKGRRAAERPRHREPDTVEAGGSCGDRAELRDGHVDRGVRAQWPARPAPIGDSLDC